jgi:hypothetical protein
MKKKLVLAAVGATSLAMSAFATVEPAAAWCRWGGCGYGWGPGAVVGGALAGAALGAAIAAPRPYYYGYGPGPYGCWRRDYYGRPFRVC